MESDFCCFTIWARIVNPRDRAGDISARSEAVSIWLSWLHRPVIRYIFEAEPRHQRMPLLPGLAGIILIFW